MATTDYWADAPLSRNQMTLFSPPLEHVHRNDDPVRLFAEVLAGRGRASLNAAEPAATSACPGVVGSVQR